MKSKALCLALLATMAFAAPAYPGSSSPPNESPGSKHTVWLDQMAFGLVTDPHGPPKRARSFNLEPLRRGGTNFAHGLGVHAPSDLHLALAGQAQSFEALVGLDDLVRRYRIPAERGQFKAAQKYIYDGSK